MNVHPENTNLLQFAILTNQEGVEHFCTTRKGGVSKGEFSSFNLGNFSDDDTTDIYENRQILARMWYMDDKDFIVPHQTHSNKVLVIDREFQQLDSSSRIDSLYGVDATITNLKKIFLCVTTADCVPVLIFDTKNKVIAAIHAGWRGIVQDILENTIEKMKEVFQSNPTDFIATIGPSISAKNYEVGDDLVAEFKKKKVDLKETSYLNKETNKLHLDLNKITYNQLVKLGVPATQIETSQLCTFDNDELFFSARRQSIHCGRMLTGIKLKGRE